MGEPAMVLGRRGLIAGAGAAAVAATALNGRALAEGDKGGGKKTAPPAPKHRPPKGLPLTATPKPIPGGIDSGVPNVGFIHLFLPGPTGKPTQHLQLPGEGLDAEPSTITDFEGYSAMGVVAGHVKGSDGATYDCEFDVRAMKGNFIGVDGKKHRGAFAFL